MPPIQIQIITILKRLNLPVSNHMSVMDEEMVTKVEQFFKKLKEEAKNNKDTNSKDSNNKDVSSPERN
ncbi:MAG: hypothetical protein WD907_06880, partial [Bacilli bacterium]